MLRDLMMIQQYYQKKKNFKNNEETMNKKVNIKTNEIY